MLVTVLALLAGCLGGADPGGDPRGALGPPGARSGTDADAQAAPRGPDDAEVRARLQRLLDARARAVRRGDEAAFRRQLAGGPRWRARQLQWFRNVVQLPWQRFEYDVQDTDWRVVPPEGAAPDTVLPRVVQRTRLRGFDRRPIERIVGFELAERGGRLRLVGDRDGEGTRLYEGTPTPWDLVPVQVRRGDGVLGVFDDSTVGSAPEVMAALEQGVREVDDVVPFSWPRRVVAYVVGERAVLDTFTDVPGGSVDLLGALTFPAYTSPDFTAVASTRMLLLPTSVAAGQPFLGRIVRHELSHVAIGERDDGAPTWFSEGLAEYVGARVVPLNLRRIPTEAVRRAKEPVDGLPASKDFNGPDQDWHYALAWMAVDALVAEQGEDVVWRLMDAFERDATPDMDARGAEVLERVTGLSDRRLARLAARRITSLYG